MEHAYQIARALVDDDRRNAWDEEIGVRGSISLTEYREFQNPHRGHDLAFGA
jgi:hypothetical protein